jgi:2-oxoglutarate ferredoxin oxidoreductase subunit beta
MGVESTGTKPHLPKKGMNPIGLTVKDYRGGPSTLCAGCGHDSITNQIIKAFFSTGVNPYRVAKMSGIGCSSKTPAYFLSKSHGFNTVHGRMPSVATGALLANRDLVCIGVSGDGDTASIGLGQFCHMVRRNVPMVYIIENNGVYGLTKGQFSATADMGSKLKTGVVNALPAVDCCALAIELGCSYVARSFAGDPKQVVALLQGALSHSGSCVLDIISPCVTFNNHPGSTKSYTWAKENEELLHEIDFVPYFEQMEPLDYDDGAVTDVEMHDGSHLRLRKVDRDFDPMNRGRALDVLRQAADAGEFLTGLIHVNPVAQNFIDQLNLTEAPLATLGDEQLRPSPEALQEVMRELA